LTTSIDRKHGRKKKMNMEFAAEAQEGGPGRGIAGLGGRCHVYMVEAGGVEGVRDRPRDRGGVGGGRE